MTRLPTILSAASLLASAGTCAAAQNQTQGQGLHSLMVAAGKLYFGTATDTDNFNDAAYEAIATDKNEFGMFTPENSMKWEVTEPRQGDFVFTQANEVEQKVKSNGQMLRCHTLVWHSQLPTFVANGTWTASTLSAVMTAHITSVVTHFAGQCYAWDVVNEALNENGTLASSVFFDTLGEAFIPLAFRTAAAADPNAKLYYNDFNLETNPAKAAGAVKLVQLVQASSSSSNSTTTTTTTATLIHGVGFQAHLTVGQTPSRSSLASTLSRFTALGLEVAYTELDIAQPSLPPSNASIAQQAKDYVSVVGSCLDVKGCVGVTVWQFTDKYSWVPSTFPGKGDACLWTEDYQKKPAYEAVVKLLGGSAAAAGVGAGGNGSVTAAGGRASSTAGFSSGAWGMVVSGVRGVRVAAGFGLVALLLLL